MRISFLAILVACIGLSAFAGEPASPAVMDAAASGMSSDLTLDNFFTEGWDQSFAPRVRTEGAQDMELLRASTNFLQQEFRATYGFENDVKSRWIRDISNVGALVDVGLNRRLMLGVGADYEWIDTRRRYRELDGMSGVFAGRVQLVETEHSSYSFNFSADTPSQGLRVKVTTLNYALAGWNDLTPFGLTGAGLYYSIMESAYLGPPTGTGIRNDLTYDVSLAKTWTGTDAAGLRNFTTFLEAFANSSLDGTVHGRTNASLTPGIRFSLGKDQTIVAGIVLPASSPRLYEATYRLAYIYTF